MAEQQPKRKATVHPRVSHSPSPAIKPAFKQVSNLLDVADFGPMGLSWSVYRWIIRVLMVLCLYQCAIVYLLCNDLV